jgi:hypothetical protein
MPQLEDLSNLTNINFVSLSNFDLIIIEMILIIISLGVPVIAFRMLMVSGIFHIHLKILMLIGYVFFVLCMLSRIVITIGILLRLDYSGRKLYKGYPCRPMVQLVDWFVVLFYFSGRLGGFRSVHIDR